MKHVAAGLHPERQLRTARAAFRALYGREAERRRAREIAQLPAVLWKGATLRTVRCVGTGWWGDRPRGRGPHLVNLPAATLWALVSLDRYHCPFHH